MTSNKKGIYFINQFESESMFDAGALFNAIRNQIAIIPNPCYCIRKSIKFNFFFSVLLGLKPYYYNYKVHKGQRGKHLGLDLLFRIEDHLMKSFEYWINKESDSKLAKDSSQIKENVKLIIDNYKRSNKLKLYNRGNNGVLEQHPDLKLDFFKNIDTIEKAYWLGWVFAEGHITIKESKSGLKYYQFGVGCIEGDFILLERFADSLGLNIVDNEPRREKYLTSKGEEHTFRKITLINNKFCNNLISQGFIVGKAKSKNIRLPKFDNRELLLSFLLGYYDGDGTMKTSRINSSSNKLLEDILNSPFLSINVSNSNSVQYDMIKKKYIVKGDRISLGTDLMRELIKNYKKSLPRKRDFWENWADGRSIRSNYPSPKLDFLYENLPEEKLLDLYIDKNYPLLKIAEMYGVSYKTLRRYMRNLGLKNLGY